MVKNRDDLFGASLQTKVLYKKLKEGNLFTKEDTEVILAYVNSKIKGGYKKVVYDLEKPEKTVYKNILVLHKIYLVMGKPLIKFNEDDIEALQEKLNRSEILTNETNIAKGSKPISNEYKKDIVSNLKQFWKFYRVYSHYEKDVEISNIVEFMKVRRNRNNEFIDFVKKEELDLLVSSTPSEKMKTFLLVMFETGARISEVLALTRNNCRFDKDKKKWIVRLPNEKGKSTMKLPIELDISEREFNKWMRNLEGDIVFDYSYDYVRQQIVRLSRKYLGRKLTPKHFRKGCAMYLIKNNVNEQYIRAHLGWSPSSKAIAAYVSQIAIEKPESLKQSQQRDYYSDILNENDTLKVQQKAISQEMELMKKQMDEMRAEMKKQIQQKEKIVVVQNKEAFNKLWES